MLRDKFEIGDCISSGEVATFFALSQADRQPVLLHLLPAVPERRQYLLSRVQERRVAGDLAILDSGEAEGRAYVVTARVESFKGFAEWLNSPFGLPPAAAVNDPLLPSNPSFADLFSSPLQATELLSRSAPPPKKKRDYQPPFPPQPSPYSQIIKRPNAVSLTATAAVEPAESSPPNVDVTAQPVLVAILEERLRLWRILTFTGFGLSAILIVVVFVALLRMC